MLKWPGAGPWAHGPGPARAARWRRRRVRRRAGAGRRLVARRATLLMVGTTQWMHGRRPRRYRRRSAPCGSARSRHRQARSHRVAGAREGAEVRVATPPERCDDQVVPAPVARAAALAAQLPRIGLRAGHRRVAGTPERLKSVAPFGGGAGPSTRTTQDSAAPTVGPGRSGPGTPLTHAERGTQLNTSRGPLSVRGLVTRRRFLGPRDARHQVGTDDGARIGHVRSPEEDARRRCCYAASAAGSPLPDGARGQGAGVDDPPTGRFGSTTTARISSARRSTSRHRGRRRWRSAARRS